MKTKKKEVKKTTKKTDKDWEELKRAFREAGKNKKE